MVPKAATGFLLLAYLIRREGNDVSRQPAKSHGNVLVVAASPHDALVIEEVLAKDSTIDYTLDRVRSLQEACDSVERAAPDIILLELLLTDSTGIRTFQRIHSLAPDIPVLVMAPPRYRELGPRAVAEGAAEFVIKEEIEDALLRYIVRALIERKQSAVQLRDALAGQRASEARFAKLIRGNADGFLIVAADGTVLFCNPAAEALLGCKPGKLAGQKFGYPVVPGEVTEIDIPSKGDDVIVAEMRVIVIEWEGKEVSTVLLRDITERTLAKREREHALRLHESTVATMPSSLLVLDNDLNVLTANKRFLEGHGLEASAVIGRNIVDVFPASLLATRSFLDRMRHIDLVGGQDEILGLKYSAPERADRYYNVHMCGLGQARAEKARDKPRPKLLLVMEDATVQHVLQDQLRHAARMETAGRLAATVAHEFKDDLTGIENQLQPLRTMLKNEVAKEHLAVIASHVARADELMKQLLAFSSYRKVNPVLLNVNDLVRSTGEVLRRALGKNVALELKLEPGLHSVPADEGQLQQALLNLALHARDAMPDGGSLTIETKSLILDERYAEKHSGVRPGPYVTLAVTDIGAGMDEETMEHVFEPFSESGRVAKGTSRLGLATVYRIVQAHSGDIRVESRPRKGTTFTVYLPGTKDQTVGSVPDEVVLRGTGGILVVDDSTAVLATVERALQRLGYTVFAASTPDEAERLWSEHRAQIDLLLTDVIMPVRNGRELYDRLAVQRSDLKVVYMSGYGDRSIVQQGMLDDDSPFLQKPFTVRGLAAKLGEVLERDTTSDQPGMA